MFFERLTNSNLQIVSFNKIKHNLDRVCATEVITMTTNMRSLSRQLLTEHTIKKNVYLHKTDTIGVEFKFVLTKPSGYIQIHIRKKRKADIKVYFIEGEYFNILDSFHYKNDSEENWLKALLFEFDETIIQYIRNGFSGKVSKLLEIIKTIIPKEVLFNVCIDIPGYVCMF
uniref:Uncharacterized protein n=1 Tax=Pyramimonas orientalis virus TaxID=455367 RepID=A0A7L9AXM0_POV01|nr:hypothetical protein HWQ62_00202 [Pyramimonas orientalis virus]